MTKHDGQYRELPPYPVTTTIAATLRDDKPVAIITFVDFEGWSQAIHLHPAVALRLLLQLAQFLDQVGAHD